MLFDYSQYNLRRHLVILNLAKRKFKKIMKTPFSVEEFLGVFSNYNQSVFPIQFIFYLLGIIVVFLTLNPIPQSSRIISFILSFFWIWMGLVYFFTFFSAISPAAYFFGTLFLIQGVLFLYYGVYKDKLSFKFHHDRNGITGLSLVLFALIVYPVLNYMFGHTYPASPSFGLPCPTTIFCLGILLQQEGKLPVSIYIVPMAWSVIGFTAALKFGIIEDTGLLISALLTIILVIFHNKPFHHKAPLVN
jgi:hypothetical protein